VPAAVPAASTASAPAAASTAREDDLSGRSERQSNRYRKQNPPQAHLTTAVDGGTTAGWESFSCLASCPPPASALLRLRPRAEPRQLRPLCVWRSLPRTSVCPAPRVFSPEAALRGRPQTRPSTCPDRERASSNSFVPCVTPRGPQDTVEHSITMTPRGSWTRANDEKRDEESALRLRRSTPPRHPRPRSIW
jgi:hypothetical protein